MERHYERYRGGNQRDAHEYLCECLDTLAMEVTAMDGVDDARIPWIVCISKAYARMGTKRQSHWSTHAP